MKKNISLLLITLLILVISNLVLFAEKAKYDFRKTNWGMSKEQVKATEDKKPDIFEDGNTLGYKVIINEKDFVLIYYFLEDKLYSSAYALSWEYVVKDIYFKSYEGIKEILIEKYGKPKIDIPGLQEDDLYKGNYIYWTLWETPTTEICLMLSDDNNNIKLNLSYNSKELEEWVKQTIEEKVKSNF